MGRNNEKVWKLTRILGPIIVLVIAVVSAAIGYGRLSERVDRNAKEILSIEAESFAQEHINIDQGKAIVGIKAAIIAFKDEWLRDREDRNRRLDRIESKLDERARERRTQ